MSMTVEHIQQRGQSFRYRRKVPAQLRDILGKGELVFPLGKSKAEALRSYDRVHRDAERILKQARDEALGLTAKVPETALELFKATSLKVRELIGVGRGLDELEEWVISSTIAEQIKAKGKPSAADTELFRQLHSTDPQAPAVTLTDAARLYLGDRFAKSNPTPKARRKDEQRNMRVVGHVKAALGRDPTIAGLKRSDARRVRDHMLRVIEGPSTVERYLNDIRAIIHHALVETDELQGVTNPFTGLAAVTGDKVEAERSKRKPFTSEQLAATRQRVLTLARNDELRWIWRVLEGTGCRLSEVSGLRVVDAVVEGHHPHIDVQWHDERRVKTEASWRKVPLIGDALAAVREALKATTGGMLFPSYGREGGGDAASAALMKHVRAVTDDRKVVVHSLRHNLKGRLRRAGASKADQDMILGHTLGGVGESYGSAEAMLEVATAAMKKAFT